MRRRRPPIPVKPSSRYPRNCCPRSGNCSRPIKAPDLAAQRTGPPRLFVIDSKVARARKSAELGREVGDDQSMAKKSPRLPVSQGGLHLAIANQDWVVIRGTPAELDRLGRLLIEFAQSVG